MNKRFTLLISAMSAVTVMNAQNEKVWSLDECISYALEENIQLQQNKMIQQSTEVDVKTAKSSLFPSLSFVSSQSLLNTPYQETGSNIHASGISTNDNWFTYEGSYGLNAEWMIANGGQRLYHIRQQNTNQEIAQLSVVETENLLKEEITRLFIQIMYAEESVEINRKALEVSEANHLRAKELFKEGILSRSDVAQLEARESNDRYQLVVAESALRNYKLQLKQLLELDSDGEMTIEYPQIDDCTVSQLLPDQNEIYSRALGCRPEIQSGILNVDNAELGIKSAKAKRLPSISLNATVSSMTSNLSNDCWAEQMKHGWNNMIGVSISIPIYSNRQARSSIEKAKISYKSTLLDLTERQKELYSTIETLWLDALNAQQQYAAAESKLESSRISFEIVNEQFNLGMKNTVELLTEKNNFMSAQQQMLQAKYIAILNRTLLNFYAGEGINL